MRWEARYDWRWNQFLAWGRHPHPLTWGIVLGGLSLWLMLPRGSAKGRGLGAVLGIAAPGMLRLAHCCRWANGTRTSCSRFSAGVTVVAAAAPSRFAIRSIAAIWFALTLLGTAGHLHVQGAQFLGVATIVVYAGAILVTFLFVLMLAQPEGDAYYDRVSWEALLSAATGAVLVGILSLTIGSIQNLGRSRRSRGGQRWPPSVLTPRAHGPAGRRTVRPAI